MVPSQLARHEKIHERAFKCKKCHFSFDTTEKLEKHKETHSVDGNFKCNSCGSLFTTLKHMRVHQRNEQCMLQRNCKAEEFNNLNDLKGKNLSH